MITFRGWIAVVFWFDTREAWWSAELLLSCDVSDRNLTPTRVLDREHKNMGKLYSFFWVIPRGVLKFMFRNVGKSNSDTGESTKRKNRTLTTGRNFQIKKNMGKREKVWC